MKILQSSLTPDSGWSDPFGSLEPAEASLVFAFGQRAPLSHPATFESLKARFPSARLVLVSTAGSFADTLIEDQAVVCTAVHFEKTTTTFALDRLESPEELPDVCRRLVASLAAPDLRHVLIFSDGSSVNGTILSEAFNEKLPQGVTLSGGLAGDGTDFVQTLVGLDAVPAPGVLVAIGLCGSSLRVGFGSSGGWSPFGPKRTVTASRGNVLQELDGKLALELYKTYLGPEAEALPASALRFPLYVTSPGQTNPVVRTILSIDEKEGTMTFAGDIPVDATVQLMRASFEGSYHRSGRCRHIRRTGSGVGALRELCGPSHRAWSSHGRRVGGGPGSIREKAGAHGLLFLRRACTIRHWSQVPAS